MTHGSLDKAGKVRRATIEAMRVRGLAPTKRPSPTPRLRNRENYIKRFIKGFRIGQPRRRRR